MKKDELERRRRRLNRVRFKTRALSRRLKCHRVVVARSLRHISLSVISHTGHVVLSVSTSGTELRKQLKYGGNIKAAQLLGAVAAKKLLDKNIKKIIFDRGLYKYHGRLAAIADAFRSEGIDF